MSQGEGSLPEAPAPSEGALQKIPVAQVLPDRQPPDKAVIESDDPQSLRGDIYTATGNVQLTYQDHVLRADSVRYNRATGDVELEGHVKLTGGENDEEIEASRGYYNVRTNTGQFYNVHGSVGFERRTSRPQVDRNGLPLATTTGAIVGSPVGPSSRSTYANSNPFLFEGKMVLKTGPEDYKVFEGSVTSCLLPHPDWQIFANKIVIDKGKASASASTFHLLGIPMLFLPYVTHPVDAEERQSGLLIPELSFSTGTQTAGSKGLAIGEQGYLTLGRSADMTLGLLYYSLRGFSENATFRLRGLNDNFFTAHFSALEDRGFHYNLVVNNTPLTLYANQGGEDVMTAFRYRFSPTTRLVGDVEYLSSYVYREAFTENFNQAVSSDINSMVFVTHETNGYALDVRFDRYEGLKVVPTYKTQGQEVKIFHSPALSFDAVDRSIANTPFHWSLSTEAAGLKRVQPNFVSSGITERFDLRPELSLPLHFGGFNVNASVAGRETIYSRSRQVPYTGPNPANAVPVELQAPVNRADVEFKVDFRLPVIEREFTVPQRLRNSFGDEMRHTVEPYLTYRDVKGVDNFLAVLRFDDTDLVSDTNELTYGVVQHLYFKPHAKPAKLPAGCSAAPALKADPDAEATVEQPEAQENPDQQPSLDANGIPNAFATAPDLPTRTHKRKPGICDQPTPAPAQKEWFSWDLKQKVYFDQNFGGAVIVSRRNLFESTLNLSGIAFLTEPRGISPLISRMRFRSSGHTDLEYDFDYDTGASKFNSQNVFLDMHAAKFFGGFSYARLNAPGRFRTEVLNQTENAVTGIITQQVSNFNQMRVLGGFGTPTRAGLSMAAGAGLDLSSGSNQYLTVQASYNWNCCGISVEYRKYNLGNVRDEGTESFNFTLANIGSAGNLRRAQSLF